MKTYTYSGAVSDKFGKVIATNWSASTRATSIGRAKSNIAYQFKQSMKLIPQAGIVLNGTIHCVGESA